MIPRINLTFEDLFLARVKFIPEERITHPRDAKAACHQYITQRCAFRYAATRDGSEARELEEQPRAGLRPALNS